MTADGNEGPHGTDGADGADGNEGAPRTDGAHETDGADGNEEPRRTDDADEFEGHRRHLFGVAYRMLGSVTEAEDVVQDAWLRWSTVDRSTVDEPHGYLTTVVSRLALDRLRSARHRRETYVGPWLPEPLPTVDGMPGAGGGAPGAGDPAAAAELADSLTFAFLTMLDRLGPDERVVLLLHDVFGYRYGEIATMLERTETGCRQLASRARRRLRPDEPSTDQDQPTGDVRPAPAPQPTAGGTRASDIRGGDTRAGANRAGGTRAGDIRRGANRGDPEPAHDPAPRTRDPATGRGVVDGFLVALATGDVEAVVAALAPDVVLVSDGGANVRAARRPVVGAQRVARFLVNLAARTPPGATIEHTVLNDEAALLISVDGIPSLTLTFSTVPTEPGVPGGSTEPTDPGGSTDPDEPDDTGAPGAPTDPGGPTTIERLWLVRNPDKLAHLTTRPR